MLLVVMVALYALVFTVGRGFADRGKIGRDVIEIGRRQFGELHSFRVRPIISCVLQKMRDR